MSADDYPKRSSTLVREAFKAKYPGACSACSQAVAPGEFIVGTYYQSRSGKTRGMSGPYNHEACEPAGYVGGSR